MAEKKNIEQLAELLAAAVGIETKQTAEQTIEAAIKKLQSNKETKEIAKEVKADVKEELKEQIADMYVSNMTPPFWDRVRMKYLGMPDLKSWAELDKLNKQALKDCSEEFGDIPSDTEQDVEDQITWKDIEDFLNQTSADEYMHTCYDDNEWEYCDDCEEQAKCLEQCKQFNEKDDDDLDYELHECQQTIKQGITADQLVEALTMQQRLKRAMVMRNKAKMIAMKRKIALKRRANPEKIKDRAHKLAIRMIKTKFAGGKPYNELSYTDRDRLEKLIANKKQMVDTLTRKMIPIVKKIEQERFSHPSTSEFNKQ